MQVPLKYQSYVARGHSLLWNVPGLEHFFAPAVIHCEITLHEDVASYVQHIVDAVAIGGEAVRNEDEGFAAGDGLYRDGHGVGFHAAERVGHGDSVCHRRVWSYSCAGLIRGLYML